MVYIYLDNAENYLPCKIFSKLARNPRRADRILGTMPPKTMSFLKIYWLACLTTDFDISIQFKNKLHIYLHRYQYSINLYLSYIRQKYDYFGKISHHTLFRSKNTKWWNYKEVTLLDASDRVIPINTHVNNNNLLIN